MVLKMCIFDTKEMKVNIKCVVGIHAILHGILIIKGVSESAHF